MRIVIGIIIGFIILVAVAFFSYTALISRPVPEPVMNGNENTNMSDTPTTPVTTFEECVAAGNAVMESYPRQCRSASGELFVEFIGNELEKSNRIRIDSPRPNQVISSPLTITGEARGSWFFEASFPVILTNWDGLIIAEHYASAEGEWMTEEFVPFTAELEFENPYSEGSADFFKRGSLILQKDNPSGLPEFDDALEIPIRFAE